MRDESVIAGGISGAITDPNSEAAQAHAKMYYEEIRHMNTDVKKIANNTEFSESQIMLVKTYLFIAEHNLNGSFRRFDECFEIAESWKRLAFDKKNIQKHDITLIKHELKELALVAQGVPQEEAHVISSQEFNYSKEYKEYYKKLGIKQQKKDISKISGGVTITKDNSNIFEEYTRW